MALPIIGALALAGVAASSPLLSRPGFLPVQKSDTSIKILPLATPSPAPLIHPFHADSAPRIKVTISPSSKTSVFPTWWPVDPKVNVAASASTWTESTTSTSVGLSALVGFEVTSSSTTTTSFTNPASTTTVTAVVSAATSSESAAVVAVQSSTTLTLSATSGSETAVTSAANVTPVVATSSASASSSSADPLTAIAPLPSLLPLVSYYSSAPVTPVVAVTTTTDLFLFFPENSLTVPSTTTITPTSTSISTSTTTTTSTSTVTRTSTPAVPTTYDLTGPSDLAATQPLSFNTVVEKVKFHDEQIEKVAWTAAISNEEVSDRLDGTIKVLEALSSDYSKFANQTTGNFYEFKYEVETLGGKATDRFYEVEYAIQTLANQTTDSFSEVKQTIKGLGKHVEYLDDENWKSTHGDRQDQMEARLEALEEQNAYLSEKLEELLGAQEDAPEQVEQHHEEHPEEQPEEHPEEQPEEHNAEEEVHEEKQAKKHFWPDWFKGVWNGENYKKQ